MKLSGLPEVWDLVIVGGGITGAGVLREAVQAGFKALLVEGRDFAWGTSSRSSKMIHGGLRYLREGRFLLTKLSVEERERLMREAPGLVKPLGFYVPVYDDQRPGKGALKVGLSIYDWMANERYHRFYDAAELARRIPFIKQEGLQGGFYYVDAQVDDARLVLRLIQEALSEGGAALSYTRATDVERNDKGEVIGVRLKDVETGESANLRARLVINATGCWAEQLHPSPDARKHLRPLRGSHLVFSSQALPLLEGFSFFHPRDNRAIFAVPWEGAVLVGTTDLDHDEDLSLEPRISESEAAYLLEAVRTVFPSRDLRLTDCLSAFAGVRPILSEGKLAPSEESREHAIWADKGLVTVTGGKLTTFRQLAFDALEAARAFLPRSVALDRSRRVFNEVPRKPREDHGLTVGTWRRLYGRYGAAADELIRVSSPEDRTKIPGTDTLWAELAHTARHENVRHLSDLLLRRVRIGLTTPVGAKAHLRRIKGICRPLLGWDRRQWREEIRRYTAEWKHAHGLPEKPLGVLGRWKARSRDAVGSVLGRSVFGLWVTLSRGSLLRKKH